MVQLYCKGELKSRPGGIFVSSHPLGWHLKEYRELHKIEISFSRFKILNRKYRSFWFGSTL